MSWSSENNMQSGVFLKKTTVEVHWKKEHSYTWYPMRDSIDSLQMPWKNYIFVQVDGFCKNTSSVRNCTQNGILVCTMCINRFEHSFCMSIDSTSLDKCMPLLTYLNVICQPNAIQNWELL